MLKCAFVCCHIILLVHIKLVTKGRDYWGTTTSDPLLATGLCRAVTLEFCRGVTMLVVKMKILINITYTPWIFERFYQFSPFLLAAWQQLDIKSRHGIVVTRAITANKSYDLFPLSLLCSIFLARTIQLFCNGQEHDLILSFYTNLRLWF